MDITNKGWMVNFIKEQDLTSYYMNNSLTGILHPGVYNANIGIAYTVEYSIKRLYVLIKKGTTLIFSNDYTYSNNICERNFSNTQLSNWESRSSTESGSLDKVFIKCTAQMDYEYQINLDGEIFNTPKQDYFVFLKVNSVIERDDDNSTDPSIVIAKRTTASDNDNEWFFRYKVVYPTSSFIDSRYIIPDGCVDYTLSNARTSIPEDTCFLCLGVIRDLHPTTAWNTFSFTTRGLPEYNHSLMSIGNAKYPDLVFYRNMNSLDFYGVDLKYTLIRNTICDQFGNTDLNSEDTTWLTAYTTEDNSHYEKPISISNGWNAVFGYLKNGVSYDSVSIDTSTISDIPKGVSINDWKLSNNILYDKVVPLDSCEYNVSRLLSCIKNVDVWSYVIGELHKSADASEINDIFPVALVYKKEDEDFVNPNNVLSYFDLYYKSSSINIYNGSMNNIFHVIPILSDEDSSETSTTEEEVTNG